MVRVSDPVGSLATAQALAGLGLNVLPARFKDKAPIVKWQQYQNVQTYNLLPSWFGGGGQRNYWVMTGIMSRVIVIDCDTDAADKWWRVLLGDETMESAGRVKTRKGHHYWFKIPDDWPEGKSIESWSVHPGREEDPEGLSFDVRADGTGVIAPPSVHESGHQYVWERHLTEAAYAPIELLDGTARASAPKASGTHGEVLGVGGVARSMLSTLLSRPPGGEGTGRNDWLARVAGHYAKTYHNMEDLFRAHCQQANQSMADPLDEKEFNKTIESVWKGEHARNPERALDASCGWLKSGNTRIMTQVVKKDSQDHKDYDLAEYADFDLQSKGVMVDDDGARTYWVQIRRKRRGHGDTETIDAVLPGGVMGDDRKFKTWLSNFACTVLPPMNIWPKEGGIGLRIQRYLESQNPPIVKVTHVLGWDPELIGGAGGFVTHDGIITAEEVFTPEAAGVIPHPQLLKGKTAPHRYGFDATPQEARRVLGEVMTFHFDDVTSIFGAWWAACLIKPQIEHRTSLFPFMAIEAPSESGKTNGFFSQMIELNGNTAGEQNPTMASLRNIAASHRNGIVWVDDLDDPANLMELIRAATSGGTLAKMSEDRESIKSATIVSPVVISGEALGLGAQKALLDRAIMLKASSPVGRISLHEPSRPQWDDVLALREQYPGGLSAVGGWLVQSALAEADVAVDRLRNLRTGNGRVADKFAILRVGARVLDAMLAANDAERDVAWGGDGRNATLVDGWVDNAINEGLSRGENSLTLQLLPWALRSFHYPERALAGERNGDLDMPVFVKNYEPGRIASLLTGNEPGDAEIWFNTELLAQAWEREKNGRIEKRTATASALRDQADALKAKSKRFKIINGGGRLAYYRQISGDLAEKIILRAQGE